MTADGFYLNIEELYRESIYAFNDRNSAFYLIGVFMIQVGIIGATGHTGEILIGLLLGHSHARISRLYNTSEEPQQISQVFPKFKHRLDLVCKKPDYTEIAAACDCVFLALPHTVSMDIAPKLIKMGKRVIDLSADYRLKDVDVYEKFYHVKHTDISNLKHAVYGLPELYREDIKKAGFVANPGCYPTAGILALAPLAVRDDIDMSSIIIDAKSGVTGAGKKLSQGFLFVEANEDFRAYKVRGHQHTPEIEQVLSKLAGKKLHITFVPHLLPLNRGILETIYIKKTNAWRSKAGTLVSLYKKFYKNEPLVRIKESGEFPRIKDVAYTNFCDIGIDDTGDTIIIISAIDNLLKGASGQAVHNMNIMFGFPETTGLV